MSTTLICALSHLVVICPLFEAVPVVDFLISHCHQVAFVPLVYPSRMKRYQYDISCFYLASKHQRNSLQEVIIKVYYFVYILDQIQPLRFLNESSKQSCNECSPCTEMEIETLSSNWSVAVPRHRTRMQFQVYLRL